MILEDSEALTRRVVDMLTKARQDQGISQNELGRLSGVSRTAIQHIESKRRLPGLVIVSALATALKVPLWKIIKAAEEKP